MTQLFESRGCIHELERYMRRGAAQTCTGDNADGAPVTCPTKRLHLFLYNKVNNNGKPSPLNNKNSFAP